MVRRAIMFSTNRPGNVFCYAPPASADRRDPIAPEMFSYIKVKIDNGAPAGSYWLTGLQSFKLMQLAQEALAG